VGKKWSYQLAKNTPECCPHVKLTWGERLGKGWGKAVWGFTDLIPAKNPSKPIFNQKATQMVRDATLEFI
jgi:hypothetical protein